MLSSSLFFGLFCSTLMIQQHSKRMDNLLNVHIFKKMLFIYPVKLTSHQSTVLNGTYICITTLVYLSSFV